MSDLLPDGVAGVFLSSGYQEIVGEMIRMKTLIGLYSGSGRNTGKAYSSSDDNQSEKMQSSSIHTRQL